MSEDEDWLGMDDGGLQAGAEEVGGLEGVDPGAGGHAKPLLHALEALLVRQTRPLYLFCLASLCAWPWPGLDRSLLCRGRCRRARASSGW